MYIQWLWFTVVCVSFLAVHIYQRLICCEWDDETDKVSGFTLYGYDGEDFLTFNIETQTWIAPKPQAVIIKHLWDNDSARNIFFANYINQVCVYTLKTNLKYGMSFLLRTGKLKTWCSFMIYHIYIACIKIIMKPMLPINC